MTRRVAYLLKKFPRLSETFILNELLAQQERGTDLHVFSRRTPDDEARHPQLSRLAAPVEILPSVREIDPWTSLFVRGDAELVERVGQAARSFSGYGHPRFGSLLAEAVWLHGRCRELDIAHVHVHFATDSAMTAAMLHALGGPTYSLTMHAKDIYRNGVDPVVLDRIVGGAEFGVTVCDANVRHLRELITPGAAARVRRLYNGIDLDAFASDGRTRDADHLLSVGRLVEKKGFGVLVEAVTRYGGVVHTFPGDGVIAVCRLADHEDGGAASR